MLADVLATLKQAIESIAAFGFPSIIAIQPHMNENTVMNIAPLNIYFIESIFVHHLSFPSLI
jgi:hypothetical protein